jgi:hypothetical protein
MRCHSRSGQPSGLLFQKRWAPSRQENKTPQGEEAYLRFARGDETRDSALRKTARSNSGLNAETRMGRYSADGEDFSLDIPFYRTRQLHSTALDSGGSNRTWSQLYWTFTADETGILRRGRYHLKFLVSLRGQREFLLPQRRI